MKKATFILISIITILVGIMWYVLNKPHKEIDTEKTSKVSIKTLVQAFEKDEQAANTTYLNQPLSISGIPYEITLNQDGQTVLFFSEDGITGVQATLKQGLSVIDSHANVTVIGYCNGYSTVVLLSECKLLNES